VSWKVVRSGFLVFVEGIRSSSTKGTVDVIEQGAHKKCFEVHTGSLGLWFLAVRWLTIQV
jgi:hypothetical protein